MELSQHHTQMHEPTFQGGNMSFFKKNNTLWDKELDEATRRLNLSRVMESYKPNEDRGIDVDSVTLSSQSKHLSRLIKLRKRTDIS